MTSLSQIIFLGLALFVAWVTYRYIRTHPGFFSKEHLSRSIFGLGVLALFLIGFIIILVTIVKSV